MLHTVKDFMVNYADKKEGSNPNTKKKITSGEKIC